MTVALGLSYVATEILCDYSVRVGFFSGIYTGFYTILFLLKRSLLKRCLTHAMLNPLLSYRRSKIKENSAVTAQQNIYKLPNYNS